MITALLRAGWSACFTLHLTIPLTIARLVKTMVHVPMRSENGNFVTELLQADGCVDDQPLSAADAQVWVKEDN